MKETVKNLLVVCAVSLLVAATAQAAAISVTNGDFETDAYGSTNITGWTEPVGDARTFGTGTPQTGIVIHLNNDKAAFTVQNDLGTAIEASKTYTISYDYGNADSTAPLTGTWTVEFGTLNGGTFTALATDTNTVQKTNGNHLNFGSGDEVADSFQYVSGTSVSGDNLAIRASVDGGIEWMGFDNFTVDVVPEPATMSLLGIGGLLALVRRRRK